MLIETPRLFLRPWRESDAQALYKYAQDPDVGLPAGWPPHTSVENSLQVIRTVFSAPQTYAVVLKETGEPVGCCGVLFAENMHVGNAGSDEAEIGYWIGKPFWGRGLIPEAVEALIAHCFNRLGLAAVWCAHYQDNHKSRRVCEKCGFVYHHTLYDTLSPLADRRTELFYKMTAQDYTRALQNAQPPKRPHR